MAKQILRLDRIEVVRLTTSCVRLKMAMEPRKPPPGWNSSASSSTAGQPAYRPPSPPPPPKKMPPVKNLPVSMLVDAGPMPPTAPPPRHMLPEEKFVDAPWRQTDDSWDGYFRIK